MNTKVCKFCHNEITRQPGQTLSQFRVKIFCNTSCAARFNNKNKTRRKKDAELRPCSVCGEQFSPPRRGGNGFRKRSRCEKCYSLNVRLNDIRGKTKGEVFSVRNGYQSARSAIQKHARRVFLSSGKPEECAICGYDFKIEVAHKRAVSSFPDDSPIESINCSSNLVALCPNHHTEYDLNQFSLI